MRSEWLATADLDRSLVIETPVSSRNWSESFLAFMYCTANTFLYSFLVTAAVLHRKLSRSNDQNPFTFGRRRKLHTSHVSSTNLLLNLYIHSIVRACVLAVKLLMTPFLPQCCFGRFLDRTLVHSFTSLKPTLKMSHFYSLAPNFAIECCFVVGTARV